MHEKYKISLDILLPIIKQTREHRDKIKNRLIFIDKKDFLNDKKFIKFFQNRHTKLSYLIEIITSQINYLSKLWEQDKSDEIKKQSLELSKSINILEGEWEKYYSIFVSEKFSKLHKISCEFFDSIFNEIEKNFLNLEKNIIESSKLKENKKIDIVFIFDVDEIASRINDEIKNLK